MQFPLSFFHYIFSKRQNQRLFSLLWYIKIPRLVDGHQFLHSMTLYERSGVLWAICDDLMDSVQNRHHRIAIKILRRVLLPTWKITYKVPQSIVPCNDRETT